MATLERSFADRSPNTTTLNVRASSEMLTQPQQDDDISTQQQTQEDDLSSNFVATKEIGDVSKADCLSHCIIHHYLKNNPVQSAHNI